MAKATHHSPAKKRGGKPGPQHKAWANRKSASSYYSGFMNKLTKVKSVSDFLFEKKTGRKPTEKEL